MDNSYLRRFDLTYPGTWIAGSDREWASNTANVLSITESEFIQAVTCFTKFEPVTRDSINQFRERTSSKYEDRLNTVYAREFVYSLNAVRLLLNAIGSYLNPPAAAQLSISEYQSRFANLRFIRDSLMHIEDRGRGVDKKQSNIPTNILVLGAFNERRLDITGEDGKVYGIEISEATLLLSHKILQALINAYSWE